MLLNQAQAEAAYSAIVALNNVGGKLHANFPPIEGRLMWLLEDETGVYVGLNRDEWERYPDQAAFATAYGLQ